MNRRPHLLGVPIDALSRREVVARLASFARSEAQHHVMTPNPEMLVLARRDASFRHLLDTTSLNLPDGVGLLFALRLFGVAIPERVTGVDTMIDLCAEEGIGSVFFLGAAPGVALRAAEELQRRFPALSVAGTFAGSPRLDDAPGIIDRIRAAAPSILFVAYGCPAQDVWIREHLSELPSVRVAIGVGGAFDFIAGVVPRAPRAFQALGFEWLYRLWREPRRLRRILTATIIFPSLVLLDALTQRFTRRGASPV